jgi:hypothetical protein
VDTGSRLRVRGEGNAGRRGGETGSLFVFVNVREDPGVCATWAMGASPCSHQDKGRRWSASVLPLWRTLRDWNENPSYGHQIGSQCPILWGPAVPSVQARVPCLAVTRLPRCERV